MRKRRAGQSIIEYVLVFGLVAAAAVGVLASLTGSGQGQQVLTNMVTGSSGTAQR